MMFCFAVLRLGLRPVDFWTLSAAEWRALIVAAAPGEAMTRDGLAALMRQYEGGGNA